MTERNRGESRSDSAHTHASHEPATRRMRVPYDDGRSQMRTANSSVHRATSSSRVSSSQHAQHGRTQASRSAHAQHARTQASQPQRQAMPAHQRQAAPARQRQAAPAQRGQSAPAQHRQQPSGASRRASSASRRKAPAMVAEGRRYVASVDGLRAFAVLAVIAYHMGLKWASGGLMGVTVFFVISGYLITGILMNELVTRGTIRLGRFWLRRIRRLFPAIVLVIGVVLVLCALFNTTLLEKMKPDVLPSLFWLNNWWQIFHEISYIEAAGPPSPLTHFWSLAIEEQYYLAWPIILLLMYKAGTSKKTYVRTIAVLAIVSALEMALLYDPHGDPSRVYYGTDTRAFSLLVGAWLALMWPSTAFGEGAHNRADSRTSLIFNVVGIAAMVGLIVVVVVTNGFSPFPYRGGTFLVSVLSAAVIAALVIPGTLLDRFFSLAPVVWIGKLSYSMYLWHFPILLLTTNVNSTVEVPWWMRLVQLALIIAVSAASYYLVENPIRHGAIGNWWRAHREGAPEGNMQRVVAPVACTAVLLLLATLAYANMLPTLAPAKPASSATTAQSATTASSGQAAGSFQSLSDSQSAGSSQAASGQAYFNEAHYNSAGVQIYEPLLIGDSVAAGCVDQFYAAFPYGHIDAEVARNVWESPYADYDQAGQVGQYVVFCLGTNNAVVDWQIDDELLNVVSDDKTVFFVNTRSPQSWTDSTNETIANIPSRHPNVIVVDWYSASAGHDEYFAGDGTHLTEEGAQAYIALIQQAIVNHMNS